MVVPLMIVVMVVRVVMAAAMKVDVVATGSGPEQKLMVHSLSSTSLISASIAPILLLCQRPSEQ